MRIFRDAACLLVAVGSLGLAVCQPFDANPDRETARIVDVASPVARPVTIDTATTTVDRAIRFSPGLKV